MQYQAYKPDIALVAGHIYVCVIHVMSVISQMEPQTTQCMYQTTVHMTFIALSEALKAGFMVHMTFIALLEALKAGFSLHGTHIALLEALKGGFIMTYIVYI